MKNKWGHHKGREQKTLLDQSGPGKVSDGTVFFQLHHDSFGLEGRTFLINVWEVSFIMY